MWPPSHIGKSAPTRFCSASLVHLSRPACSPSASSAPRTHTHTHPSRLPPPTQVFPPAMRMQYRTYVLTQYDGPSRASPPPLFTGDAPSKSPTHARQYANAVAETQSRGSARARVAPQFSWYPHNPTCTTKCGRRGKCTSHGPDVCVGIIRRPRAEHNRGVPRSHHGSIKAHAASED